MYLVHAELTTELIKYIESTILSIYAIKKM